MYCKNCGEQLDSGASYCKHCGATQSSTSIPQNGYNFLRNLTTTVNDSNNTIEEDIPVEEQVETIQKLKLFYTEDEELIDSLGSGFILSLLTNDNFKKSVLICSNKRVYQMGKFFEKNSRGQEIYRRGERSIDLREITGISYYFSSPVIWLVIFFILFVVGAIGLMFAGKMRGRVSGMIYFISIVLFISSLIFAIIYRLKKDKWILLEYCGGAITTKCNWYSDKNIRNFIKNIAIQKEKLIS